MKNSPHQSALPFVIETLPVLPAILALLSFVLLSCIFENDKVAQGNPSEETTNGVVIGYVVDKDGMPINGALARLYPAGYQPTTAIDSSYSLADGTKKTLTNSEGRYQFDSLPIGRYTVDVKNASNIGVRRYSHSQDPDKIKLDEITSDTAKALGTIVATVQADSISFPLELQLLGSDISIVVNSPNDTLKINGVSPGPGELRLTPSYRFYGSRIYPVEIQFVEGQFKVGELRPNLLANGDLEAEPYANSWLDYFENGTRRPEISWTNEVSHSANHSVKISGTDALGGISHQHYNYISPGKTYNLKFWVKSQNVTGKGFWVWSRQISTTNLPIDSTLYESLPVLGTSEWKEYQHTFTTDSTAKKISFFAHFRGSGTIWIDDIVLELAP